MLVSSTESILLLTRLLYSAPALVRKAAITTNPSPFKEKVIPRLGSKLTMTTDKNPSKIPKPFLLLMWSFAYTQCASNALKNTEEELRIELLAPVV
jgi:hypothetical protein